MDESESEVRDRQSVEEPEAKPKPERRIYKGEVHTVRALQDKDARNIPVQPMKRHVHNQWGGRAQLPPSFMVSDFRPGYDRKYVQVWYYTPQTMRKNYIDIPLDFEFNVLSGRRAQELSTGLADWQKEHLEESNPRISCTIGSDPEIFVEDAHGAILPAFSFLGSKKKPTVFDDRSYNYEQHVYWDGFQAEFTTHTNTTCLMQVADMIHSGLHTVYTHARTKDKRATLSPRSVLPLKPEQLMGDGVKEEHVQFGCAPSLNIYGLEGNKADGRDTTIRFAGGHIHFGLRRPNGSKLDPASVSEIVRALDDVLGVACVSMFAEFDNPVRRQYYGLPGEYRLPAHGLEYRTLSNAWMMHPLAFHMTFDLARMVMSLGYNGVRDKWVASEKETVETIINHDVKQAREILKRNEKVLKGILRGAHGAYDSHADVAARIWQNGIESAVKDPTEIAANWELHEKTRWARHSENYNATFARCAADLKEGKKV